MHRTANWKAPAAILGRVCLFQACAFAGLVAGFAIALTLASARGLPLWFIALLLACTLCVQAGFAVVRILIYGRAHLVFYHGAAAFVLTTMTCAWASGEPVRLWLDTVTPAVFGFLALGRIGCWSAGCCYGRPSRFGFRYGDTHQGAIVEDFASLPLLPVQLAESLAAACVAWMGCLGAAFVTCFGIYGAARFLLEYLRGEPGRRIAFGLTAAQWTSAAVMACVWPISTVPVCLITICYRPRSPDEIQQILRALQCTRISRAVATTSSGLTLRRRGKELVVDSPSSPAVVRRLHMLDELLCETRNT